MRSYEVPSLTSRCATCLELCGNRDALSFPVPGFDHRTLQLYSSIPTPVSSGRAKPADREIEGRTISGLRFTLSLVSCERDLLISGVLPSGPVLLR
jgi:hypothetical protein